MYEHTHTHTPGRGAACSGITEALAQFPSETTKKQWTCKLVKCPAQSPAQSRAGFGRHCLSPFFYLQALAGMDAGRRPQGAC